MSIILSSGKRDFILDPVCTNVAGMLGFSDETSRYIELSRLGAFITNPISLNPRTAARPPRSLSFPGGFLFHTGHPNPGLERVIQQHQRRWSEFPCPVIVHLLGQNPEEVAQMVERLEDVEAVVAIELGLEASDSDTVSELTTATVMGELPVIAHVPLDCSEQIALAIAHAGANAISLGPPRGSVPGPGGDFVSGRLFGPALFPHALHAVSKLSGLIEIPIIGSGGIYSSSQAKAMLVAGAKAVQFDSVLWTEPELVLEEEWYL